MWRASWAALDLAFVYISLQTCRKMSYLEADAHDLLRVCIISYVANTSGEPERQGTFFVG